MDPRPTILPPNASALMRAVDQAVPQWDALPGALRGTTYGHPDALAPWLAGEWGLSQFARYFNANTGELLATGVPWLRERGTAAAVRRAMGWLGFTSITIEEDGALLHIDPGAMVTAAQTATIAHVVRASIPVHVDLYRLYHGLDVRPLVWDQAPTWDNAVWEFESGTPVDVDPWGDPVLVSQMSMVLRFTPRPKRQPKAARRVCFARSFIRWPDGLWDGFVWDQDPAPLGLRVQRVTVANRPAPALTRAGLPHQTLTAQTHAAPPPNRRVRVARITTANRSAPAYRADPTWETGTWDERPWLRTIPHNSIVITP